MLTVIVIALAVAGIGIYLGRRTRLQRSNDLRRWIVAATVGMIAFLVLGITYEDWYFFWFFLTAGILVVLLGVWAVLRWRRGTVAQ